MRLYGSFDRKKYFVVAAPAMAVPEVLLDASLRVTGVVPMKQLENSWVLYTKSQNS